MLRIKSRQLLQWLWPLVLFGHLTNGNQAMKRLYDDLLSDYNRLIRPVPNYSHTVLVNLSLKLTQLLDLNMKQQVMSTNVWLEQSWIDPKLSWDPRNYDGVDMIHVPAEQIWQPDIVLFNNYDGIYEVTLMTKAVVYHTGQVVWRPPAMYKSTCEIDVQWFPFDVQECTMKFGSWTYDGFEVDLKQVHSNQLLLCNSTSSLESNSTELCSQSHLPPSLPTSTESSSSSSSSSSSPSSDSTMASVWLGSRSLVSSNASESTGQSAALLEIGIDMSEFYPSVEWDILAVPASYQAHHFTGLDAPYPDISFKVRMRRKTLFYTVNLILPVLGNAFLTLLVFYLPSDSGEKVTLSISVLVSLTVFFLLLAETIPPTSLAVPLLGKYLLFTMVLVSLSICVTVGVLNVHFRTPSTHELKPWMRWFWIEKMPQFLFMKRPTAKHLQQELNAVSKANRPKNKRKNKLVVSRQKTKANGFVKFSPSVQMNSINDETIDTSVLPNPLTISAISGSSIGLLDPNTLCDHYDTDLGMPSYFPAELHVNQLSGHHLDCNESKETICRHNLNQLDVHVEETIQDEEKEEEDISPVKDKDNNRQPEMSTPDLHQQQRGSCSSSMDSDIPVHSYSEDVQSAIDGILYIAQRLKDEENENKIIQDWKFIAMVLDRLFLWIFSFICLLGSAVILLRAPSLYDQTRPIDHLLSNIGR